MVTENKEYLDLKVVLIMVLLTMLWGFNCTAVKYSNQGLAPVFTSALRSVIASIGGVIYCVRNKEGLFHTDKMLFYEFMVGLLYRDAAHSIIFVNTSPSIVAVGAHFLLKGDRLTAVKMWVSSLPLQVSSSFSVGGQGWPNH